MKTLDSAAQKQIIFIGAITILILGLVGLLILLNFYFTNQLAALQSVEQNNVSRITQIENFLNQQMQAAQKAPAAAPADQTKPVKTK